MKFEEKRFFIEYFFTVFFLVKIFHRKYSNFFTVKILSGIFIITQWKLCIKLIRIKIYHYIVKSRFGLNRWTRSYYIYLEKDSDEILNMR